MKSVDFCSDWRFQKGVQENAFQTDFDDGNWENVSIPHTWNADDMAPGMPAEKAYLGPAWYRKRFRAGKPVDGSRLFLLFEAVANFSEVWVDGKFLGGREGGFLSFRLDITEALDEGEEHVVAVRADNSFRWGSPPPETIDWERYGGMYRPVWLLKKGGAFFGHKSIRIRTPKVTKSGAKVTIRAAVEEWQNRSRALTIRHRILDPHGAEICVVEDCIQSTYGRFVETMVEVPRIARPKLWSPETPNVYRVESTLLDGDRELDREINPLGFRWFRFDPDKGFSLNGRPMKLCGVDIHQEFPGLGIACPERFHRRDVEQMKGAGLNFMRASHYPRNERMLDACDELGIMVMEEQPFWHGSLRVEHGEQLVHNARRLMREMVEHHGNHPSIIVWNTVNEVMLLPPRNMAHPDPSKRDKSMRLDLAEWPFARRVLSAMSGELRRADPSRPTSMVVGGSWKLNEEAGLTRLTDMVGYNGGAVNSKGDGKTVYDVTKENDPQRICIMTEGVLNDHPCLRAEWDKELVKWETYAEHWTRFYERDWFCGGAMWVFADYSAKGHYRNMAMVDFSRLPYEGFYFFKAMWTGAPMAHICCHWDRPFGSAQDRPGEEGKERRVVVFTNCVEAELFLNGASLGKRKPNKERWPKLPHPPMEWTVAYAPGELKVVARKGKTEVVDTRVTSGAPAAIQLRAESVAVIADGQDVAFITATIVDVSGRRCYNAHEEITIDVSGACRLAGPRTILARGGIARFAIRSNGATGSAEVSVSSGGLRPSALRIAAMQE